MADIELNPDPRSTYGASESYRAAWFAKYGTVAPAGNAEKAKWVDFAVAQGADREEAEEATVADLKAAYGTGGEPVIAPSQGDTAPISDSGAGSTPTDEAIKGSK